MKRKELRELARKIAKQEKKLQQAESAEERRSAEEAIMQLTSSVNSFDDLIRLDEMILEILSD